MVINSGVGAFFIRTLSESGMNDLGLAAKPNDALAVFNRKAGLMDNGPTTCIFFVAFWPE